MDRTQLFRVLLDAMHELSSFAPYAFEGASIDTIKCKMEIVGNKLIEASKKE